MYIYIWYFVWIYRGAYSVGASDSGASLPPGQGAAPNNFQKHRYVMICEFVSSDLAWLACFQCSSGLDKCPLSRETFWSPKFLPNLRAWWCPQNTSNNLWGLHTQASSFLRIFLGPKSSSLKRGPPSTTLVSQPFVKKRCLPTSIYNPR